MAKDSFDHIVTAMRSRLDADTCEPLKTRDIADATGLTIYQARTYLEQLHTAGVVGKVNIGKGVPGLWRLL
ncbi:regulator [Salmonella enterica]|uniref:Regulator n=1 Tax=Salmonella enterica TaxID=28901 RepID=A0A742LGU9_SALER|nr:regulator [Salmonella enterica]EBL3325375.1 regulator [Salmonella enterica subsp. enterica]EBP3773424.1 regulator [Salmonella enterica subsp. arizonae]EDC7353563.1 regulator [Salmonella enterica subsp. enterica serovar Enteritidis]EDR3674770.1 regulator [Salmonella enterica subsp. arizonae serovar 40:z4,z24:]EED6039171.1 regulator [Salmonella enterica subsp. enterica serovar Oranienburg]EGR7127084.1 regulator [Salmonella enterica subsp. enterica serovar Typhimurium]EKY1893117.1 regulator 